jgi:hypothetical protein
MGKLTLAKELKRLLMAFEEELYKAEPFSHRFSPQKFTQAQLAVLQYVRDVAQIERLRRKVVALHKKLYPSSSLPTFHDMKPFRVRRCLRESGATSYRRIVRMLRNYPELKEALKLTEVPHYSTLAHFDRRQKRAGRIPKE